MNPIIQTENLTHIYSTGTPFERTAIENITFSAQPGERVGIIGHTGSGKSTFIQHLNGLLPPTEGTVRFDGEDIHSDKARTRQVRFQVGLVFQYPEYQLFEETVFADIAFGPKNMGLDGGEVEERVRRAADFVGLEASLLQQSPFELSGGQKRRAAIAGVIAMEPRVLILDEPTAGLDPRGREEILGNIRRFHRDTGATILMVTHNMEELAKSVDRIVVFDSGHIAMAGSRQEIFSRGDELEKIGLSVPETARIVARLRALGLDIDPHIYTTQGAAEAILALRGGEGRA